MDEAAAAAYYDAVKEQGAAAQRHKQGLGFSAGPHPPAAPPGAVPPPRPPPAAYSTAPGSSSHPPPPRPPPPGAPWAPHPSAAHPGGPPPGWGGYGAPHMRPPPMGGPPPPGGPFYPPPGAPGGVPPPRPPGPQVPGAGHPLPPTAPPPGGFPPAAAHPTLPPYPPPGHPYHPPLGGLPLPPRGPAPPHVTQAAAAGGGGGRPPGAGFAGVNGGVPYPQGLPPGQPLPPGGVGPPRPGMPQPPPPQPPSAAAAAAAAAAQAALEEEARALEEEAAAIQAEEAAAQQRAEAAARQAAADAAWTAHKAPDGQVYYYNTVTNASSWERPAAFRGDAAGVAEAPVPVAQAAVPGTSWREVKCADGRRYYYNTDTNQTAWTTPEEVIAAKRRQQEEADAAVARARLQAAEQRAAAARQLAAPYAAGAAAAAGGAGGGAPGAGLGGGGGGGGGRMTGWQDAEALRQAHFHQAMMARQAAASSGAQSKAGRLSQFKALLREAGVNAFSFWDKVRPQLEKDERWGLLATNKERRAAFDDYCRDAASQHKANAAAAAAAAQEGFGSLLEEAALLERQLRVQLLAQQLEAEAGEAEDEAAAAARAVLPALEDIPEEDLDLSMDILDKYWGNDERWLALPAPQRAALFQARFGAALARGAAKRQEQRQRDEAAYHALLVRLGVTSASRWTHTRPLVEEQGSAAELQLSPEDRESLFRAYVDELRAAEDKAAAAQRDAAAREEAAAARAREAAAESAARQAKAARADAVAGYQTLLAELVRDPEADFGLWRAKLRKDAQGRASNPALTEADYQDLFWKHTRELRSSALTALRDALEDVLHPLLPVAPSEAPGGVAAAAAAKGVELPGVAEQWEAAEEAMGEHATWQQYPSLTEVAWRRWVEEVVWGRAPPAAAAAPTSGAPGPTAPLRDPQGTSAAAAEAGYGRGTHREGRPPPYDAGGGRFDNSSSRQDHQHASGREPPDGYGRGSGYRSNSAGQRGDVDFDREGRGYGHSDRDRERDRDRYGRDRDRERDRDRRDMDRERDRDRDRDRDRGGGNSRYHGDREGGSSGRYADEDRYRGGGSSRGARRESHEEERERYREEADRDERRLKRSRH